MRISDWSSDVCSSDLWSDPPRHDVDLSDRRRLRLALRDASAFAQRYCEVAVVETERAADRSKSARFQHNKTEARVVEHTDTPDRPLAVHRPDPPRSPAHETKRYITIPLPPPTLPGLHTPPA